MKPSSEKTSPKFPAWLVGINPIMWSNDDFQELGGSTPLERCLSDIRAAGYLGAELGHKFPRSASALAAALETHDLRLVSGWHSTYLATRDFAEEQVTFQQHLRLLRALGASVFIVAECSDRTYPDPDLPLGFGNDRPRLDETGWKQLTAGLKALVPRCVEAGMKLVYHHHMGTVIQTAGELDRLLNEVPELYLLLDPGHLAFAGIDPVTTARTYASRIGHVHLKNVRPGVVEKARRERWSFCKAVREGVFTIAGDGHPPSDGSVDFSTIFEVLRETDYRGWLVVEAEEDPLKAEPASKAKRARDYVRAQAGV